MDRPMRCTAPVIALRTSAPPGDGTGSVEDASRALGFSRAKGYDLVRRGEFPCRVLRIGRTTRVVTASLLRVLESGEPEYNRAPTGDCTPP
ncbi:helix-turn-helix domain-containing protein [Streptomyces fumanus]|uniref:helix-turn-helix domain-containing protein n=1 Tax=Streptomyces fumanus TaxID=67302 RepID=UPI00167DA9DB|nr:helix-turn-helix domain-containing protein [Streptomyces fumanus]